jgi:hypothetical protein
MNILPKIPPSSVRSGPSIPSAVGTRSPEPRPYLLATRPSVYRTKHPLQLFPHESEDARLTGETRSLYRRLLALNLPVATGSLTRIEVSIEKIA